MKKQYRHGDLLLEEVQSIPMGGNKRKNGIILAGEATGHHHRIGGNSAVLDYPDEKVFVEVNSPTAPLTHEEHNRIDIPAGKYRVIRQREYDPYEGVRNVLD